jgi:hypothetical protein
LPDEKPESGVYAFNGNGDFQILLTNKRIIIAKLNLLRKPVDLRIHVYEDMKSSCLNTSKMKTTLTLQWRDGSVFTGEITFTGVLQARKIATRFPIFEEKPYKKNLIDKIEYILLPLFALLVIISASTKFSQLPREGLPLWGLLFSLISILVGVSIIVRKRDPHGNTGVTAIIMGIVALIFGVLFGIISMFWLFGNSLP